MLAVLSVIIGHIGFAYLQWAKWERLAERLLGLTPPEAQRIAGLGRSFAAYNLAIAVGLSLSFWLDPHAQFQVQAVVMACVIATAAIGASGTRGKSILLFRLLPAAAALVLLIVTRKP